MGLAGFDIPAGKNSSVRGAVRWAPRHVQKERQMSYPEPRYRGDSGELSAWLRRADHPPELTYPNELRHDNIWL
jgi:hypothetical protein